MWHCRFLLVFIGSIACGSISQADPSFSCAKSSKGVETLICASKEVSDLDAKLSKIYKSKRISVSFRREQATWLVHRDKKCKTDEANIADDKKIACLKFEYERRLALLDLAVSDENDRTVSFKEFEGRNAGHKDLRFVSTFISQCLRYLDIYKVSELVPWQTIEEDICGFNAGDFTFKDLNFDGRKDLLLYEGEFSGQHNSLYHVRLFNPNTLKFEHDPAFPQGSSPEVDENTKELSTYEYLGNAGRSGTKTFYKYRNARYWRVREVKSHWFPEYCTDKLKCLPEDKRAACIKIKSCYTVDQQNLCNMSVSETSFYDENEKVVRTSFALSLDEKLKMVDPNSLCK
jgi:uncharacterized protein